MEIRKLGYIFRFIHNFYKCNTLAKGSKQYKKIGSINLQFTYFIITEEYLLKYISLLGA